MILYVENINSAEIYKIDWTILEDLVKMVLYLAKPKPHNQGTLFTLFPQDPRVY